MSLLSHGEGQDVGPIPMATGAGVMCSPRKGCIELESTTVQYAAYGETTVCTYLCIICVIPVWVPSSTVPPALHRMC